MGLSSFTAEKKVIDALWQLSQDMFGLVADAARDSLTVLGVSEQELESRNNALDETREARDLLERTFSMESSADGDEEEAFGNGADSSSVDDLYNDVQHGSMQERIVALIKLRKCPSDEVENLVETAGLLGDDSERIRSAALYLIRHDSSKLLHILQNDKDQGVRSAAIDVLAESETVDEETIQALIKAYETDAHWLVRASAAIAMGDIGKGFSQVEDSLIASLEDTKVDGIDSQHIPIIRRNAITALGFLGSIRALPALGKILESRDVSLRYRLAGALAGIRDAVSVQTLRQLCRDPNAQVAAMASSSLARLEEMGVQ